MSAEPLAGRFWRVLSPRWRHAPLSGDGAARHGGRWNSPGMPALYLSLEVETAFAEYQQELGTRPGLFVAYDVEHALVEDVRDPAVRKRLGLAAADLDAPWKETAFVHGKAPPTWPAALRLARKAHGIIVPSAQRPGGSNLVLWRWNHDDGAKVSFHDPKGDLA